MSQKMKNQVTKQYLPCFMMSMIVLCANAWAGSSFFDDFSNGDTTDGSPVNWIPFVDASVGTAGAGPADLDGNYYIYRDLSISAQIKRISDHTNSEWVSGLICRWSDGPNGGYWIEVRPPNRFLFGHRDRYILRSATLPFNVDETELIIRVDAVGDELKAWCWQADEPMPEEPQISLIDDVAPEGMVGFYYSSQGGEAIYRWVKVDSLEVPIVDFNGNGKVDIKDLLKMIQYWNQNEPSVDINGDSTVDDKDLEILMEFWDQNVDDPTLLAHWALDETDGLIAYDSAGTNDAVLSGDPAWQPTMGQLDSALELDGDEDCIITGFVLNPADGPFSVIAWVEGGAPGQVILSQLNNSNWLEADPDLGCLMTGLIPPEVGRFLPLPLKSECVITDGQWHRIGFVWDGSNRALYVDDILVAEDTQVNLQSSFSGMYIGTGKAMEAGTFWSGLIDDVRIYNRAVRP